jgi:hypothetical protein
MDPFESYKLYNALKLHFESGYDAVKYNFKSNVTPASFFKRRDKYFFAKLAKKHNSNLKDYYISNFKVGLSYVGDMIDEEGENNYKEHKRIQESIHRVFAVDINKLDDHNIGVEFNKLFESSDGQLPEVIKLWMQEEISLETVVILNSILGFVPRESKRITDTIIWPDIQRKIEKYTPFVNFNVNKCKTMLINKFT